MRGPAIAVLLTMAALAIDSAPATAADPPVPAELAYEIVGDGIPAPLAPEGGDPLRGRALVVARDSANCVLCHEVPDPSIRFAGDVGPTLAGVGKRLTAPQLRLCVVDNQQINRATVMPSYHRVAGLALVATPYVGKPILTAREVEDVVSYLATLR
jgi:sulfur-oxidizing protein SoxX